MSPIRLIEPTFNFIGNTAGKPVEAHAVELANFASWLAGAAFLLLVGGAVGGAQKNMVNYMLEVVTPEEIPLRIPQTRPRKEPWQMTSRELFETITWGAEPAAAIPGEPVEFLAGDKDWDTAPAALFSTDDYQYYIRRDDGSLVLNPKTYKSLFESRDEAWIEYHRQEVFSAIKEGKDVPPDVLADYPGLTRRYRRK